MFLRSNKERNVTPVTQMSDERLRYRISKGETRQEVRSGEDVGVNDPTSGVLECGKLDNNVVRVKSPYLVNVDPEGPTFNKNTEGVGGVEHYITGIPKIRGNVALDEGKCLWTLSGEGDFTRGTGDFVDSGVLRDRGEDSECVGCTLYK